MGIIFGSLPERILDWMYDQDRSITEDVGALVGTLVGSVLMPIPTFVTPILENFANWSLFYNRPVEPGNVRDLEPVERTGLGVSGSANAIARTADKLNDGIKAALGMSPESSPVPDMLRSPYQVDHLIYGVWPTTLPADGNSHGYGSRC
jgi:Large polyvalent protein associated domain 38